MFKLLFVVLAALLAVAFASPIPAPQYVHGVAPVSAYYGNGALYPSAYGAGVVPAFSGYTAGVVPTAYSGLTYV